MTKGFVRCMKCDDDECVARQSCQHDGPATDWLLYSVAHSGEFALWWKPDRAGYTTNILQAGHYTKGEAEYIVGRAYRDVRAISPDIVAKLMTRTVVPVEENFNLLTGKDRK